MPMVAPTGLTAQAVREFPNDGNRYEVVNGELLVTPAPSPVHQRAVSILGDLLRRGLRTIDSVELLPSPADIVLGERTLVQPDLFVTRRIPGGASANWRDADLLLAIEVLSPSTARYDRLIKRDLFNKQGIEFWIVDLDARLIERWRPGDDRPEILAERIEWRFEGGEERIAIDLARFFEEVMR